MLSRTPAEMSEVRGPASRALALAVEQSVKDRVRTLREGMAVASAARARPTSGMAMHRPVTIEVECRLGRREKEERVAGVGVDAFRHIRTWLESSGWRCVDKNEFWDVTCHSEILSTPVRARLTPGMMVVDATVKTPVLSKTLCSSRVSVATEATVRGSRKAMNEIETSALAVCDGERQGWVRFKRRETFALPSDDSKVVVDLTVVRQGKDMRSSVLTPPVYEVEIEAVDPCDAEVSRVFKVHDILSAIVGKM